MKVFLSYGRDHRCGLAVVHGPSLIAPAVCGGTASRPEIYELSQWLAWRGSVVQLAETGWKPDFQDRGHHEAGIVAVMVRQSCAALRSYGLSVTERLCAADPGNAEWQRGHLVSCGKIVENLAEEAKAMWSRALEIAVTSCCRGEIASANTWITGESVRRLSELP